MMVGLMKAMESESDLILKCSQVQPAAQVRLAAQVRPAAQVRLVARMMLLQLHPRLEIPTRTGGACLSSIRGLHSLEVRELHWMEVRGHTALVPLQALRLYTRLPGNVL
jgi:hypothetical protein